MTINEIKHNHLKIIASAAMNIPTITSFVKNFKQISMNRRNEIEKFEPGPSFEKFINEIKHDNLKSIDSTAMNISYITSFANNFKQIIMNRGNEVSKFEPGPTYENTINEVKHNNLKSIVSAEFNLSAITSFDNNFEQLSMNIRIEVAKF